MSNMRRRVSDVKPYEGRVEWDSQHRFWIITVENWTGGPRFHLNPADVFDQEVLRAHLILANLSPGSLVFVRSQECRVNFTDQIGTNAEAAKLLKILRDHYSHFKGRPIHWMRRPGLRQ